MRMVIKDKLLEFTDNLVMGILNVTPDSFYSESRVVAEGGLLQKVEQMISDGADILDIGGYSSRPGAKEVSIQEEIDRISPAIESVRKAFPEVIISLDTFRSEVAEIGLNLGASMINDISAGFLDEKLPLVVAQHKVPYIIMHMKGTPQTMQNHALYTHIMQEMIAYFSERISTFQKLGIQDIILDPGFGFAKTVDHNFEIIEKFELLQFLNCPILSGISRKSFIQKKLNVSVDESLNGTTAMHAALLMKGSNILRVHDVREAKQTVELVKAVS